MAFAIAVNIVTSNMIASIVHVINDETSSFGLIFYIQRCSSSIQSLFRDDHDVRKF